MKFREMKHFCLWIIRVSILLTVSTLCWAQGTWRAFTTADGLVGNSILGIMEDKDRNLWIQTNDGLSIYDGQFRTIHKERSYTSVQLMASDGSIWIATEESVTRYQGGGDERFSGQEVFDSEWGIDPISLFEGVEGEIWLLGWWGFIRTQDAVAKDKHLIGFL